VEINLNITITIDLISSSTLNEVQMPQYFVHGSLVQYALLLPLAIATGPLHNMN
jgi:hypothetical protein